MLGAALVAALRNAEIKKLTGWWAAACLNTIIWILNTTVNEEVDRLMGRRASEYCYPNTEY